MATSNKPVIIGCKLPHGITLEHPANPEHKVEIAGLNKIRIIGADHATTPVDPDFWGAWFASNMEFPAVKSGAIFVAKSAEDADAIAREFASRKTGFEPLSREEKGIKPADKD